VSMRRRVRHRHEGQGMARTCLESGIVHLSQGYPKELDTDVSSRVSGMVGNS